MKIKEGYILRNVAGSFVVVPIGEAASEFNGMMNLNDTGAFLFEKLIIGGKLLKCSSKRTARIE